MTAVSNPKSRPARPPTKIPFARTVFISGFSRYCSVGLPAYRETVKFAAVPSKALSRLTVLLDVSLMRGHPESGTLPRAAQLVEKLGGAEVAVVVVSPCANVCNVRPNARATWPCQTFREDSAV